MTVTIGVDRAPLASDDIATIDEDTNLAIADAVLLSNDTDPENTTLAIAAVGHATHGTVTHTGTQITFVPDAEFSGAAEFEYTVTDGFLTDVAKVAITINAVDDPPVAVDDIVLVAEGSLANALDVLANDTDIDDGPRTIASVSQPLHGTAAVAAGGADGANNAEVHNTGEVWTTMLWESYAALLRDTLGPSPRLTFQDAQDRMKKYVIAALKVTPVFPTFLEARDALLAVALASDPTDYVAFRIAFARRGAGAHAIAPDRFSGTNVGVEDFATGPELAFDSATLDDSLGGCDNDGVLDHGEYGKLTVTLRNTGTTPLEATTAVVSSPSTDVWYPSGARLSFPAIAPGATGSASLRVAYVRTVVGVQQVDFQVDFTDAQLATSQTTLVGFRTNTDENANTTATDSVEPVAPPMTTQFGASFGNVAPWRRTELAPLEHVCHVNDPNAASDQMLISPVLTIGPGGTLNLELDHTWSFEAGNFDGAVIELSTNGGAFADIGVPAYNGTIAAGGVNPLRGRPGFVGNSPGTVHTTLTQTIAAGSTVQVRFRAGSDIGGGGTGWNIDLGW